LLRASRLVEKVVARIAFAELAAGMATARTAGMSVAAVEVTVAVSAVQSCRA
jgi:hypothetical protein